jgi:hypothetical protein
MKVRLFPKTTADFFRLRWLLAGLYSANIAGLTGRMILLRKGGWDDLVAIALSIGMGLWFWNYTSSCMKRRVLMDEINEVSTRCWQAIQDKDTDLAQQYLDRESELINKLGKP